MVGNLGMLWDEGVFDLLIGGPTSAQLGFYIGLISGLEWVGSIPSFKACGL